MNQSTLLHELIGDTDAVSRGAVALTYGDAHLTYAELQSQCLAFASGLMLLGVGRGERVAVYLEKRFETVIACFGTAAAGAAFVPINPLLKPEQLAYILRDCAVQVLITSPERHALLAEVLAGCPALRHVVLTDSPSGTRVSGTQSPLGPSPISWSEMLASPGRSGHRVIDSDMVAILYTSGSTGRPKGVVLSHRNMVMGAKSVASYLGNHADDTLLAALPFSFDAGFSQLTTAFHSGARVVLLNYLFPRDVLNAMARERVTGLTAVPPLYIQLARLNWPLPVAEHLRYFANTGGRMPAEILQCLRQRLPHSQPFLMYGLTEAFRSTFLPPAQVAIRPDSIGKAIPNAEILVLREDGTPCAAGEPGELVHRGALVSLGYWNDPEKTAERFRPLPKTVSGLSEGLVLPEMAVFSGDTVRKDEEGYLYFIGRRDEMIKTSGYRVSPTEVEEVLYASGEIGECAVFGVDDDALGQAIRLIATPPMGAASVDVPAVLKFCRDRLPAYMQPAGVDVQPGPLLRNPNGKIDRKTLAALWATAQAENISGGQS